MGVELKVSLPAGGVPEWPAVARLLAGRGLAVQMRMIDGELAFPDEEPPAGWREIRVGAAGAMVTVRRGDGVSVVGWGNGDAAQEALWRALAWAFAAAGEGRIGPEALTADEFARGRMDPEH